MYLAMPKITKQLFAFALLVFVTAACGSGTIKPDIHKGPVSEVVDGDIEMVWRSLQLACVDYPVLVNDYDGGVIETDFVRSDKAWVTPSQKPRGGGYRYKLTIRALRLRQDTLEPAARISVWKKAEDQRDFFTDPVPVESDGLEEKAIIYRVKRELEIMEALRKEQNKTSKGS